METVSGRNEEEGFFSFFWAGWSETLFVSRFKRWGGQLISLSPRRGNVGEEVVVGTNVIFLALADGERMSRRRSCCPAAIKNILCMSLNDHLFFSDILKN